jgi:NmrA-like family
VVVIGNIFAQILRQCSRVYAIRQELLWIFVTTGAAHLSHINNACSFIECLTYNINITQNMTSPSIDPTDKIIVVFGITGKQGGAAAKALLDKGFKVRGVTRDINSSKSKAWADKGAELTTADLNDTKSLENAFNGAYGIFLITDHSESGAVEVGLIDISETSPWIDFNMLIIFHL